MVSKGFLDQSAELVHQGTGRDRDQVTAEGQEPAGEGVASTHPEGPALGVSGDRLAQAERCGGGAGSGGELDGRGDRVTGAELPALTGARMLLDVEALGDLVLVEEGFLVADAEVLHPVHPVVLDGEFAGGAGGEIPVLVEVKEPERLDSPATLLTVGYAVVGEGDSF